MSIEVAESNTVLGFSTHTGWAAIVAVARSKGEPVVVAKRRVQVAWTFEEGAVYHQAEHLSPREAEAKIAAAKSGFERLAKEQLRELIGELARSGQTVVGAALISGSAKSLPPIESILKSHALVHTAEGLLYRDVFATAIEACDVAAYWVKAKELRARARTAISASEAGVDELLARLGKASGRPWTRDQKDATLAAISVACF